jgi:hypothetical protein
MVTEPEPAVPESSWQRWWDLRVSSEVLVRAVAVAVATAQEARVGVLILQTVMALDLSPVPVSECFAVYWHKGRHLAAG